MIILGIIIGLLFALLIFVIQIYLTERQQGIPQLQRFIEEKTRPTGAIIFPQSDQARSIEEKIVENEKRGRDTDLNEI